MPIEYLPGLNAGDKIDLSQFQREKKMPWHPELQLPALQEKLRKLSGRPEYKDFVDKDGRILMTGPDGGYDQKNLEIKEKAWAREQRISHDNWLLKRESNPPNLAELGLTLLFDRVLGDKFFILRASDYDDYENGADNIIIDRASGAVICGVDDVLGNVGDDGGEKKEDKIRKKMAKGGINLKYGATINEGKLISKPLSNLPLFYFSLSKDELDSLLASLVHNDKPDAAEQKIYQKLIGSLSDQHAKFSSDKSLNRNLQRNLVNFLPSLEKMKAKLTDQDRPSV